MNKQSMEKASKMLSYILRHRPDSLGLQLDQQGWVQVDELLEKNQEQGWTKAMLEEIVNTNDKQRFALSADKTKIRENQGHSIPVALDLLLQVPPEILYHGTVAKFLDAIKTMGLLKMSRQHVHLSKDKETAVKVATRRGAPLILEIAAAQMQRQGHVFYLSDNGVWLTEHVPSVFIKTQNVH